MGPMGIPTFCTPLVQMVLHADMTEWHCTLTCSLDVTAQKTISVKPCVGNMRKHTPPITRFSLMRHRDLCFLHGITHRSPFSPSNMPMNKCIKAHIVLWSLWFLSCQANPFNAIPLYGIKWICLTTQKSKPVRDNLQQTKNCLTHCVNMMMMMMMMNMAVARCGHRAACWVQLFKYTQWLVKCSTRATSPSYILHKHTYLTLSCNTYTPL